MALLVDRKHCVDKVNWFCVSSYLVSSRHCHVGVKQMAEIDRASQDLLFNCGL